MVAAATRAARVAGMIRHFTAAAAIALALASATSATAQPRAFPAAIAALPNGMLVNSSGIAMQVTALSDSILRVRVASGSAFPEDASWAVPADVCHRTVAVRPIADGFATSAIVVHIDPATLRMTVTDASGQVVTLFII